MATKILIIRFSSIGDIVLTSPIVRALYFQAHAEVHFVVKKKFLSVVENNPYLKKVYTFEKEIDELVEVMRAESYDYIIDLHHNLRSIRLSKQLGIKASRFKKLNLKKWLLVNFKIDKLPQKHIVERYFEAIPIENIKYDGMGLDYFAGEEANTAMNFVPESFKTGFNVFVVGGAHFTKQIPEAHLIYLASLSPVPIVLLGGHDDFEKAERIAATDNHKICNLAGKLSLNQSAYLISQSTKVITGDTGLMHIAAAYQREIHSLWGNTVPEFGMTPFYANDTKPSSFIHQVKALNCRPCSKIGFDKCPKGHFKCMNDIDLNNIF